MGVGVSGCFAWEWVGGSVLRRAGGADLSNNILRRGASD